MPTLAARTTRKRTQNRTARTTGTKRRVTPEDLLRIRTVGDARISPDGGKIAFVSKSVGEKNEVVSDLWWVGTGGADEPRRLTAGGKDSKPRYSPDGATIAFVSAREKTRPQIYTISVEGGEATALTSFPEGSIASFKWSPSCKQIAIAFREQDPDWTSAAAKEREQKGLSDPPRVIDDIWYRLDGDGYFNARRHALYLVDVETGEHRCIYAKDTLGFFTYDFAPDGKRMVIATNRHHRALFRDWNDELLILNLATGALKPVPNLPRGPKLCVAWSPSGDLIAYAGRRGSDDAYSTENLELWVCDPTRGAARSLTGAEDYCLMAISLTDTADADFDPVFHWTPDGRRLIVQIGWHGASLVASVPARGRGVKFLTDEESGVYQLGNLSKDGSQIALLRTQETMLGEVYVGSLSENKVQTEPLTSLNQALLKELDLARIESHWVVTPDDTTVHTWIMKPPGFKPGKRYPAVIEIHGGPHAQYSVGFFHEFQVLASAGYVVVFSNPRGSKGYGRDHCAAIRGDWGGADWVDIQAVTSFVQDQPFVDSDRIGIMGGSYGGYMTNWAIGHSNVYKAAITDRCVSNLVSMAGSSDFIDRPDHYWEGNAWDRPEKRWSQSPLRYFQNVDTPTLIIHSEGDLRCNIEQAEQVHATLSVRNVPTRFVRYPHSTSHGLSRGGPPDLRVHRLKQIVEWLERWLT